jgi:hypothetical protein
MRKRQGHLTWGVVLILMMAFLVQGCGLKADPAPRRIQPLKPLTDVRLQAEAGGIFNCSAVKISAIRGTGGFGKMQGMDLK